MTDDKPIYISAEDDITTVRERLSSTESRHVTLIVPEQSQLRSLTAWRILHKTARDLGKEVSVISTDPQVRSVAKEANFAVAPSPSSPTSSKISKSRTPSRPARASATGKIGSTENATESRGTKGLSNTTRSKTSAPSRSSTPTNTLQQAPETGPTSQQEPSTTGPMHQWHGGLPGPVPLPSRDVQESHKAGLLDSSGLATGPIPHTTETLFEQAVPLNDTESAYNPMYELDMSGEVPSLGRRISTKLDKSASYSVDDEDYQQAAYIRNAFKDDASTPATPFPSSPVSDGEGSTTTPTGSTILPATPTVDATDNSQIRDIRDIPDIQDVSELDDSPLLNETYAPTESLDASYRTMPLPSSPESDPYTNMEDAFPSSRLAEQHASAMVDSLDTSEHEIQGASSDIVDGEVEYLGDDQSVQPFIASAPIISNETLHSWGEPLPDEEQPDEGGPSRFYKPSSRTRRETRGGEQASLSHQSTRSRQLGQPKTSRAYGSASARPETDEDDYLPPFEQQVEDRPTVIIPPREGEVVRNRRPSGRMAASSVPLSPTPDVPAPRPSKSLQRTTGKTGNTGSRGVGEAEPSRRQKPAASGTLAERGLQPVPARAAAPVPASVPAPARQPRQAQPVARASSNKRPASAKATRKLQPSRRSNALGFVIPIVLAALIIGALAYLLPTANVTVALPSKAYTHAVTLKAGSGTGTQSSTQLSNDFFATGVGKASGTTTVGLAPATGTVTFTNTGTSALTIPTGTIVTTSGGIAFATQAEAVVTQTGSSGIPIEVPVQAQSSGKSGNVDAGTITVLPSASLTTISQANNNIATANIKLGVVNANPTTGGGTGTAPAATQKDIDATKATLAKTLNAQYQSWLKQRTGSGDLAGVLSQTETLVNAPTAGAAVASDGTFTEKLHLNVAVLIIRAATVQQASATQMNEALKQDKTFSAYTMVQDARQPIQVQQLKTMTDGKAVTFNFQGAGKAVPSVSTRQIQQLIAGKRASDAQTLIKGLPGVQNATVITGPQIGKWSPGIVPLWSPHIYVHVVAGT